MHPGLHNVLANIMAGEVQVLPCSQITGAP
uniref:Uncharacterized protein n=1 Tax=Arundo donax TaxID=35708 RepID=A0A0A9GLQ8_ARUDO